MLNWQPNSATYMPKNSNPCLERHIQAYPPPKYYQLVKAYAKVNDMKVSETVSLAIRDFFDRMPEAERQRIVQISKHHY